MRIALLGDIHYYRLLVPPWQLFGKRLLGQTNLWLNRRHRFDHSLLQGLCQRLASVEPDLLLLSGDLTTTSLPGEFQDLDRILGPLTGTIPTVAVPGNHDRYTYTAARQRTMERTLPAMVPEYWPHFRKLTDRWRLLALDAAMPTLFNARGRVGREQRALSRDMIAGLTADHGLVVLCHYPLKSPPRAIPITWDHKLADSLRLRRLLMRCPARLLYLHGHIHKPWCWQPKRSNQSHFTYINAGAPCMTSAKHPAGQGFWQIDLPDAPAGELVVTHHIARRDGPTSNNKQPGRPVQWLAHRVL